MCYPRMSVILDNDILGIIQRCVAHCNSPRREIEIKILTKGDLNLLKLKYVNMNIELQKTIHIPSSKTGT